MALQLSGIGPATQEQEKRGIINGGDEIIIDFQGQPIRFPYERWLHIIMRHLYMAELRETIGETLQDPDIVIRSRQDPEAAVIYQKWLAGTAVGDKWVRVVVKVFDRNDAFVLTAFARNLMETGDTLWQRESG